MLPLALALALHAADAGTAARPVQVTADRLEVKGKENRAVYVGHARAARDSTTLSCDTLEVLLDAQREVSTIIAKGHVVAVDGDREATGEQATYDNRTGVLTVIGDPQGRQGNRRVRGTQVRFTTGVDRVEVDEPRTVLDDEKTPGTKTPSRVSIDAKALVLEGSNSVARWTGAVKAVRGPTTMLAPVLEAHSDASGAVTRVRATGGVEVTDGDKWARGARADFDNLTGVLVVTGNPQARQGKNRMKGSKVTWISGGDLLEVDNATTVIAVDKPPPGKRP
jgi:lipopolysaccharide transport protein LptA